MSAQNPNTPNNPPSADVYAGVKDYYGNVLKAKEDLKTSACCLAEAVPDWQKPLLAKIHSEVLSRFYGCGSPLPSDLQGLTVLDLGCGTGRDAYLLSQLVGESGKVIGVDMTEEQLKLARDTMEHHREAFGYQKSNVDFRQGFIEDLRAANIADSSVDLIVSNCVVNLSPRKDLVFSEMKRVLKPGGEVYFSDVFADRRISEELQKDPVLYGECLSGALYLEDFRRLMAQSGFNDVRVVSSSVLDVHDKEIAAKLGDIRFFSNTVRAFAVELEDQCEDFGQALRYKGTSEGNPHNFVLDNHHTFPTGAVVPVCGNTADMIQESRLGKHFEVFGDKKRHFGLFDCGPTNSTVKASSESAAQDTGGSCC